MPRHARPSDNASRDNAGAILTLRRRDNGEPFTLHVPGPRLLARLPVALAPFAGADWFLAAVSTPRTILADLRGHKWALREGVARDRQFSGRTTDLRRSPEASMLGHARRLDLLETRRG